MTRSQSGPVPTLPPTVPPRPVQQFHLPPPQAQSPPRPLAVTASTWLWVAAAAVAMASTTLMVLDFDQLSGTLLAEADRVVPAESAGTRQRAVAAALAVLIGCGALVAILQAGLAVAVRAGRRWARLVLLPLWLLGAGHTVVALDVVATPVSVAQLGATVLGLAAVVAMSHPVAGSWFAARSAAPRGGRP